MTDRKKLEEALGFVKSDAYWENRGDSFKIIIEAAEAHLASLPKPMWQVRVWQDGTHDSALRSCPSMADALEEVSVFVRGGARKVEIWWP